MPVGSDLAARRRAPDVIRHGIVLLAIVVALASVPVGDVPLAADAGQRMAITIDDLPWNGATAPGESVAQATRRLLATLTTRGVPAAGFVNCARTGPNDPVLLSWREAGMELGNHGAHHLNIDGVDLSAWVKDVRECHDMLTMALGRPDRLFRFPYLHQGATESRRATALAALRDMGYTTAHVSIDDSEWILAEAYGRALRRGDSDRQDAIATAYVEHMAAALAHFTAVADSTVGRDMPHILLLHANALAADHLGRVLDDFRARGVVFVSPADALTDPIYHEPDRYVGPRGLSWLYRIDPEGTRTARPTVRAPTRLDRRARR